jgi:hypothetical protein
MITSQGSCLLLSRFESRLLLCRHDNYKRYHPVAQNFISRDSNLVLVCILFNRYDLFSRFLTITTFANLKVFECFIFEVDEYDERN